jgi:thiamine-monophosphate kinase
MRSRARPGDSIFVTGSLGGAAGGLELLESGVHYRKARGRQRALLARQLLPEPRVEAGKYLSSRSLATSMIDISDGLAADLHHICEASGVGAEIDLDAVPVDKTLAQFPLVRQRAFALGGGEDLELIFTSKQKTITGRGLPTTTRIGTITANAGVVELVTPDSRQILPPAGYRHF